MKAKTTLDILNEAQEEIRLYKDLLANHDDLLERAAKAEKQIAEANKILEPYPTDQEYIVWDMLKVRKAFNDLKAILSQDKSKTSQSLVNSGLSDCGSDNKE